MVFSRLPRAFSRVPAEKKVYAQDWVEGHADRVCDLISNANALFYI